MSISPAEQAIRAVRISVTDAELRVQLADGRILAVPIAWYARLAHGSARERGHWQLIGQGLGIHWPDLDEDISVEGLLAGRRSGETAASFKQWLNSRTTARGRRRAKKVKPLGGK